MVGKQHSTLMENPIPTWTKARTNSPQTVNANKIAKEIHKHFGVQLKSINMPVYRKPYPKWNDKIALLLREYKT